MKVGFMARMALSVLLPCMAASVAIAQDAVPETPPELRDFRLDPERPAPQPQPQPEVQPPPVVPTVEPEASAAQPRVERTAPSRARDTEQPTGASAPEVNRPSEPLPEFESEQQPEIAAPAESVVLPPAANAAPAPTPSSDSSWWQVAAAVAAALALLGGWLLFRRRRKGDTDDEERELVTAVTPAPASIVAPSAPARPITVVANRPQISLEFIPEKATLGFSSLTLKGQLQLVNNGDASASDMQLRLAMISANQRQKETIAAFTGGSIPVEPKPLGEARAGERLALDIEMAVQVSELDSYMIGEKKIFVPVMLANLAYAWDGGTDNVTMAWMVGRETTPLQEKMGPLRLDLGPRSFSPLGQRPIYA